MRMFIFALLNVFEDMYQDLGISIQFLVQINMTVSHRRYQHTHIIWKEENQILCLWNLMPIQKSGQFQKYDFGKTKKSHFRICFFGF